MKKYKQLRFEDLVKIETLMEEDFKPTEIAIQLSKDKSCIYRCIKNNSVEGEFKADVAYELIRQRKLSSVKPRRLLPDSVLAKYIVDKIEGVLVSRTNSQQLERSRKRIPFS